VSLCVLLVGASPLNTLDLGDLVVGVDPLLLVEGLGLGEYVGASAVPLVPFPADGLGVDAGASAVPLVPFPADGPVDIPGEVGLTPLGLSSVCIFLGGPLVPGVTVETAEGDDPVLDDPPFSEPPTNLGPSVLP